MSHHSHGKTLEERFWAQVNKTDACWLWTGHTATGKGYGRIRVDGKYQKAHRVAYEMLVGPIPDGMQLDHIWANGCTNRNCVKAIADEFGPPHLEPVTNKENGLRGNSPMAQNARKTHCPKGHPYEGDNLYPRTDHGRRCRICKVEANKIGAKKRSDALTASGKRKFFRP
jgi:hypothetical protein